MTNQTCQGAQLGSDRAAGTLTASSTERKSGLVFRAAATARAVEAAWSLVYDRYLESGLIDPNPFGLHTHRHAVGPHSCVVYGPLGGHAVSTMTLMADNPGGLSLDSVYGRELDALRVDGRVLLEVGLLADRRSAIDRTATALFDMMRWAKYYADSAGVTDIIVGVHPHHVGFYERCFGFRSFGGAALFPTVKNNPVVPLRLDLAAAFAARPLPRGLRHVRDNPLPMTAFASRFLFDEAALEGTVIKDVLRMRERGG